MNKDINVLRELGKKVTEISQLPVQAEKRELWRKNNDLEPVRPMVYIDQLPWHEINRSPEMILQCENKFLRTVEQDLRMILYRWKHFPCDMVVENEVAIPMEIHGLHYGIDIKEEVRKTDEENDIVSHRYSDQVKDLHDLDELKNDEIWVDTKSDKEHLDICGEIFEGIIPVRLCGEVIHSGVWDRIAQMRPAEQILWDMIDRPDFIRQTVEKFVALTNSTVDQCERLGILDQKISLIHCTGAYTNDLPPVPEGDNAKSQNVWSFGMSQIFSTVSPAMHEEFEIDLVRPLLERFGLMYYGCCEPLHNKIDIVRKIKNVRKISVSPWADPTKAASEIGQDYVLSFKPNPAYIADGVLMEKAGEDIDVLLAEAKKNNTPVELILKDVSTINNKLSVLDMWEKMVMRKIMSY